MTHYALICPATTGHLNPMLSLGKVLQQRGHQVTLIGFENAQSATLAAGLDFQVIAPQDCPKEMMAQKLAELGKLSGLAALKYTVNLLKENTNLLLRDVPDIAKAIGVEAFLIDQVTPAGGTVAEYLDRPFVTICSAVVLNREITIPPGLTAWNYDPSWRGKLRNQVGYQLQAQIVKPITQVINHYREQWQLSQHFSPNDRYSSLAQISQQPPLLEFPRQELPTYFHFTGPFHSAVSRTVVDFPWEQLTDKPLIYASLGTLQNQLLGIFQQIAEACANLEAQLVISLGRSINPLSLPPLPRNPLVVEYAPQLDLLQRATLTITHAGLNTTLDSLSNGVPLVAIPITNDQPGTAARIAWSGCGEFIPVKKVTVNRLRQTIQKVLTEPSYRQNALRLQANIHQSGGVEQAATLIEQAITTGKPVERIPSI
ncbi:MAG: glycosyltransferase [Microcystaceae cyanobacterium]